MTSSVTSSTVAQNDFIPCKKYYNLILIVFLRLTEYTIVAILLLHLKFVFRFAKRLLSDNRNVGEQRYYIDVIHNIHSTMINWYN